MIHTLVLLHEQWTDLRIPNPVLPPPKTLGFTIRSSIQFVDAFEANGHVGGPVCVDGVPGDCYNTLLSDEFRFIPICLLGNVCAERADERYGP